MEHEDLLRELKELWDKIGEVQARHAAAVSLLRVCLDLLKDDPRFPETLTRFANLGAGNALASPVRNEALVFTFLDALKAWTPSEHQRLVQGG